MKRPFPYLLIIFSFFALLVYRHSDIFNYKFNLALIPEYLRSQDIEDKNNTIKNRIFLSDSDLYVASGYLYVKGEDPAIYNFQHPPLIKYLFGLSAVFLGNPLYIQIVFGLVLLFLTYFLGKKLINNMCISLIGVFLLLMDPVFSSMMSETLLDLGQAVFALIYVILTFFYPENFILQGIVLGLFAASKFWSTAVIFVALIFGYKVIIKDKKANFKKVLLSLLIAFLVFSTTYLVSFIKSGGTFNIFLFQGKVLKFMLSHNSATALGGSVSLFLTGYFAPWWQKGVLRSNVWSITWPVSAFTSLILVLKTRMKNNKFFFYLLPLAYILLTVTQVPFSRYFIIILPYLYINLSFFLLFFLKRYNRRNQ